MKKLTSIEELKKESVNGADFFILLNHGLISRKNIWFDKDAKHFEIINYIDGSEQTLTEQEIMDKSYTNIGEAIKKRAFFKDD
jgi:hypothetical protein